jgi:hypothetical protein
MKRFFCCFKVTSLTILLLLVLVFSSCKSSEKLIGKEEKKLIPKETKIEVKPSTDELLVKEIHTLSPKFSYYSAKLGVDYGSAGFSGNIRIAKDSIIWVSLGKFGIEAARIMITKDSILFINKLTREYFSGGYDFIVKFLGFKLNYDIIQAVLLGEDFSDYGTKDFKITRVNDLVTINFQTRANILQPNLYPKLKQNLTYNNKSKKIERNYFEMVNSINKMDVNYPSYITLNNISLPKEMKVIITTSTKMVLTIKTENHKVNQALEFPFSIPKSYDPIK